MPLGQSSHNSMEMVTAIPSHLFPKHFPLPSEIMTSTTGNSLQLSEHWMNGDTTFKGPITQQLSFATTRTSPTTGRRRNSHDHKNLTYYREAKKLTRRQARWSLYLSEFDIKLVHTPGTKMILSDALSRRPDFCPDEDHDNEDVVMLPDHMFLQLIDLDLQQKIALSDTLDQQALDALTFLLNDSLTIPSSLKQDIKDWTVHMDDTYFIKEKPTFLGTTTFEGILFVPFMITLLRDIPASWGHITLSVNIIGGRVYECLLKTTSRVAASANNSRSIAPP